MDLPSEDPAAARLDPDATPAAIAPEAHRRRPRPLVSDWRNFETWQADGARTAMERANWIWKRLLAEAVPPALDPPAEGQRMASAISSA